MILLEAEIIESIENSEIQVIPQDNNVLLITVMELMNKGESKIDADSYFSQSVTIEKETYPATIFSLDNKNIPSGKQAYLYLISEVPKKIIGLEKKRSCNIIQNRGQ